MKKLNIHIEESTIKVDDVMITDGDWEQLTKHDLPRGTFRELNYMSSEWIYFILEEPTGEHTLYRKKIK